MTQEEYDAKVDVMAQIINDEENLIIRLVQEIHENPAARRRLQPKIVAAQHHRKLVQLQMSEFLANNEPTPEV